MHTLRLATAVLLVSGLLFGGIASAQAQALPPEADKVIKDYEAFEAQAKKKMDDELMSQYNKALADLKVMQDDLTKQGNLDGALAVRNAVNNLKIMQKLKGKPILPDPGSLTSYEQAKPGEEVIFNHQPRQRAVDQRTVEDQVNVEEVIAHDGDDQADGQKRHEQGLQHRPGPGRR